MERHEIMNHKYEGIFLQPTKEQECTHVSQVLAGAFGAGLTWSVQWCSFRLSGYSELEEIIPRLCEGGYISDKRGLPWPVACEIISGPMEDVLLPPLTIRHWQDRRTFASMEEFFDFEKAGNRFGTAFVSIDIFCAWWHRRGAKVGRKINGEIVWQPPYGKVI